MHDIFISYSSKDQNVADAIVNILENRRIKCWIAYRDASAGANYAGSIVEAIKGCKACVLIFSEESNQSKHVLNEIDICFNNSITIIPFKITDTLMNNDMIYYLGRTHWLEALTGPLEAHINKLADRLVNLLKNEDYEVQQSVAEEEVTPETNTKANEVSKTLDMIKVQDNIIGKVTKAPAFDNVKYRNLFEAYATDKFPRTNGYIVSSFFCEKTAYSIYEIVSYGGVKEIFLSGDGLQFIADGKKLHILVQHATYEKKFIEPVSRDKGESIPKRFSELEELTAGNQTKIMVAKEPMELIASFTILKPTSINFSVVFFDFPDVYDSLAAFFKNSLNRERKVPEMDAKKAAKLITSVVEKTMSFKG